MKKIEHCLNHNRFIPVDTEELTALELIGKTVEKTNEVVVKTNEIEIITNDNTVNKVSHTDMLDKYKNDKGDHVGSWQGVARPEMSEPGIQGAVIRNSDNIEEMRSYQHISKEYESTPNNLYKNTTLVVEKKYKGKSDKTNVFEGSSIHSITTCDNDTETSGTVHGITSQVHYKNMGGDKRSELTPLFLDCNSEDGGSLWGFDLNINAPIPTKDKAFRLCGGVIRMSNYHDTTVDGDSVGLSVVTVPGTGGAGEDRYQYESKPIDVGLAVTGFSGKSDLTKTDVAFKKGIQVGGRVSGWQPQGGNSQIGTAIELSQFEKGIVIKNTTLGTPLLVVKDGFSEENNIEMINYSGAVQIVGVNGTKQLVTFRKNGGIELCNGKFVINENGEVNIGNSIVVTPSGVVKNKVNNVVGIDIASGLSYIDITLQKTINDTFYNVFVDLNWLTNHRVINKTNTSFRIEFSSPSVVGAKVGYCAVAN